MAQSARAPKNREEGGAKCACAKKAGERASGVAGALISAPVNIPVKDRTPLFSRDYSTSALLNARAVGFFFSARFPLSLLVRFSPALLNRKWAVPSDGSRRPRRKWLLFCQVRRRLGLAGGFWPRPWRSGQNSFGGKMMDPVGGNLFDIPDYEHTQDEKFQPLPPPDSPGGEDEEEPEGGKSSQTKESSMTTRKGVKRPMPKLDAQRLISERGLPALRNMFDNVKFKGKGHEAADLKMLIKHMEHWAHRLFPKLQFEDFVERVECLGNKKEVQTCLKRIRLDLPILHEDFPGHEGEDGGSNGLNTATEEPDIFSEHQSAREDIVSSQSACLTEEQQQRIERNKRMALERRQAKLQLNSQSQEENELPTAQPNEECDDIPAQEQEDLTVVEVEGLPFQATEMQCGHEDDK